jgi:hypothetical protein
LRPPTSCARSMGDCKRQIGRCWKRGRQPAATPNRRSHGSRTAVVPVLLPIRHHDAALSASICCNAASATETFIGAAARTGVPICLAVLASLPVWLGGEICAHDCDLCSRRAIERDPQPHAYMDQALTPVAEDEEDTLDLPTKTTAGRGLGRACEKPRCVATSSPSRS